MPDDAPGSAPDRPIDCLVVGGGPAGLAAAVQLARLRRTCIVVDDDAGRSLWSQVTRNHLGFPDGVSASDLRLLGQRQAVRYGASLRRGRVTTIRRLEDGGGFRATIAPAPVDEEDPARPGLTENRRREAGHGAALGERRTVRHVRLFARTVILATGVVDAFPAFAGRDECVGVSLFWCIVCDGYEARGRHVAVVGDDDDAIETAFGLRHFTDRVTLLTNRRRRRVPVHRLAALRRRGVDVRHGVVGEYRHRAGRIETIALLDGEAVACDMVFVSVPKRPRTGLARGLGAKLDASGYVMTDADGRTSVEGLLAAGDATAGHSHQVTTAAHQGATAATAVNYALYDPDERGEA